MANIRIDGMPSNPGVAFTDVFHTSQGGKDYKATLQTIYDVVRTKTEPAGKVISVAWNADPSILGYRAIALNGQGVLASVYDELTTAVYCGDANNATASAFYRATDSAGATRSTSGEYLILPDARGRVIRGLDLTGSVDPDGASRDLGSGQNYAISPHSHNLLTSPDSTDGATAIISTSNAFIAGRTGAGDALWYLGTPVANSGKISSTITGNTSSETRMINLALDYIITY